MMSLARLRKTQKTFMSLEKYLNIFVCKISMNKILATGLGYWCGEIDIPSEKVNHEEIHLSQPNY